MQQMLSTLVATGLYLLQENQRVFPILLASPLLNPMILFLGSYLFWSLLKQRVRTYAIATLQS